MLVWATKTVYEGNSRLSYLQTELVKQSATFPPKIKILFDVVFEKFSKDPRRLLINLHDRDGFRLNNIYPCVDDDGYLINSGVDPVSRSASIQLILIRDGSVLKTWLPDWENIGNQSGSSLFPVERGGLTGGG